LSQIVSLRLPDETATRLKEIARLSGRTVNEIGSTSIEEWIRQQEYAEIEFRSFQGVRYACLKGHIRVWKIIMTAQDYAMDAEKTAKHFELPLAKIKAAFHYYEAYPDEINRPIDAVSAMTFDKLKRLLPSLEAISIPTEVLNGEAG